MGALKNAVLPALALLFASSCATSVWVRKPETRVYSDPVYESSRPFLFWGLVGVNNHVYIDQICLGRDIDQISTETTFGDAMATLFTLGIYAPRTLKVWCQL